MMLKVACTNFGGCWIADDASEPRMLDAALGACPNCGKSFASPHSLELQNIPRDVAAGDAIRGDIVIRFGNNCARSAKIFLIVDGEDVDSGRPASEKDIEFPVRDPGIYSLQARLETDDGRRTFSDERLVQVARPSNPALPVLIWALLIILLLCFAQYFGVFSKLGMPSWASHVAEFASVVSALMIGGLFLDLGRREKAADDARSLVRPDYLSSKKFEHSDRVLNRAGGIASSSVALSAFGILPFCLGAACLAGFLFEQQRSFAFPAALALSIVIFGAILWREELRRLIARASPSPAALSPGAASFDEPPAPARTDTQPAVAAVPDANHAEGTHKPQPDGGKA